jgi:hypothetical protein
MGGSPSVDIIGTASIVVKREAAHCLLWVLSCRVEGYEESEERTTL